MLAEMLTFLFKPLKIINIMTDPNENLDTFEDEMEDAVLGRTQPEEKQEEELVEETDEAVPTSTP